MSVQANRMQNTALRLIKRWGAKGKLRRNGVDRDAWIAIVDFTPRDRDLIMEGLKRILIASKDLDIPPDREEDLVVFNGEIWRFASPVRGPRPNGVVVYYECEVIYDSRDV